MPCRVVIFGSGSRGNSLLVASPQARVLIDMGLPQRRIVADLAAEGLLPTDLHGVIVTHTHGDHAREATLKFCWRHKVPLLAAGETVKTLRRRFHPVMFLLDRAGLLRDMPPRGLHLDGLHVRPFEVPHDAEGPTFGYRLTMGGRQGADPFGVVVATDLGHVPPEVLRMLGQANVLVLEANHDPAMLAASGRPQVLIDRISGPSGHLANHQTAAAVEQILAHQPPGQLQRLVLAHLSQECNEPGLALSALRRVVSPLGARAPRLMAAGQDERLVVLPGRPAGA